jgi:hypothetical protein
MTSRERVRASLRHRTPDRIPVDFGSTAVTGMHVNCVAALRRHFGLPRELVKVWEPYQMLGRIEEDLARVLGLDVQGVPAAETMFGFRNEDWKPWRLESGLEVLVSRHFETVTDARGDLLVYPGGDRTAEPSGRMPRGGHFFDTIVRQPPLDEARLDPEDNLEEFEPVSDRDVDYFRDGAREAEGTGRAVVATFGGLALGDIALVPAPFLKRPRGIRDIEEWYVSTLTRRDYVRRVFEGQVEIALRNLDRFRRAVGDSVDVVFICGTDFGTQLGTFCSVETFRSLYQPYYRRINDWIHAHTGWKTFKHSCGAVFDLMGPFIDSGFDIVNPVQCSARGMDPARLKAEFGADLVFWGGGVETQTTLAFGSREEVRAEVLRRCEILGREGGFVFNAVHNVQADTRVENIAAVFEALAEFNGRG